MYTTVLPLHILTISIVRRILDCETSRTKDLNMAVIVNMAERFFDSTSIQRKINALIEYIFKRFSSSLRDYFFSFLFQA